MGGPARVRKLRMEGRATARDHIDRLCDGGSFVEIGTFAGTAADGTVPGSGDGKVAGHARVEGRPITVIADDITVKRASSSTTNAKKIERVVRQAKRAGSPIVFFGESGGARLPDMLHSESFASEPVYPWLFAADRPPLVSAIVGESYGSSSFVAARADVSIMLAGSVMALTSPRVIEVATGMTISDEALGGAEVNATLSGTVDLVVDDYDDLYAQMRAAIALLTIPRTPSWEAVEPGGPAGHVPLMPGRGYDMHAVLATLIDPGYFELARQRGGSIITALGRVEGRAVGIVASQPCVGAGALTPQACDKVVRLIGLCERLGYPIVCLQDTPGFQVGVQHEHDGLLNRAMDVIAATTNSTVPVITVVVRKAFGLAFFALFGPGHGADVIAAWPDAQIGFMAPAVAANVLYADEVSASGAAGRQERLAELADRLGRSSLAVDVASVMGIDELIEPDTTRAFIAEFLGRMS